MNKTKFDTRKSAMNWKKKDSSLTQMESKAQTSCSQTLNFWVEWLSQKNPILLTFFMWKSSTLWLKQKCQIWMPLKFSIFFQNLGKNFLKKTKKFTFKSKKMTFWDIKLNSNSFSAKDFSSLKMARKALIKKKEKKESLMKLSQMFQKIQRLKPLQAMSFLFQEVIQFKATSQTKKRDQKLLLLLILKMKDLLRKSEKSD